MEVLNTIIGILVVILIILIMVLIVAVFIEVNKKQIRELEEHDFEINDEKEDNDHVLNLIEEDREYDRLKEIVYSSSGDSNGNIDKTTLDVKNKKLIHEYKEYFDDPLTTVEYRVDEEDINNLKYQIDKYNFPSWEEIDDYKEEVALDAPNKSLSFNYDNSANGGPSLEWYTVDFDKQVPDRKALNKFVDDLLSLQKKSKIIKRNKEKN